MREQGVRSVRRLLAAAVAALAAIAGPVTATPAAAQIATTPTPTWTPTSGRVYAITQVGDTVIIGGSFTALWSPDGGQTVSRDRLAAFDAATGDLLPWNPAPNGDVRALEPAADGTGVYVGGAFTAIAGAARTRLALVSLAGSASSSFRPQPASTVLALERVGNRVFLGGYFSRVNGAVRQQLAAVDATTGALVSGWVGQADAPVRTLQASTDGTALYVGGQFGTLAGQSRDYLGAVAVATGETTDWHPPIPCTNATNPCYVFDLAVSGTAVFAGVGGPGGRVSTYDVATGQRLWQTTTDGDVQAITLADGKVIAGGHFDTAFGGVAPRAGLAALDPGTGAVLDDWKPGLLYGLGVFDLWNDTGTGMLHVGGGFLRVDADTSRQRYTSFAITPDTTDTPDPVTGPLVAAGATWRWVDGDSAPTGWASTGLDDSAWAEGPAQLGFGDGDEATVIPSGALTYYFRRTFTVDDAAAVSGLDLGLIRDDGAAVYLNGTEVLRSNLPTGTLTAATYATSGLWGSDESTWVEASVPASLLRSGSNVIAVEVHQNYRGSSDLSFDLRLTAS